MRLIINQPQTSKFSTRKNPCLNLAVGLAVDKDRVMALSERKADNSRRDNDKANLKARRDGGEASIASIEIQVRMHSTTGIKRYHNGGRMSALHLRINCLLF